MSNSGSLSSKGVRFVSNSGNSNLTVSDGKVSKLDLEVIDSKLAGGGLGKNREEHLDDVMSVLESTGQAAAATGNPFTRPKSAAPDPEALLSFINQANERDEAAEAAKHPKFSSSKSDNTAMDFADDSSAVDTNSIISNDDYLSNLIGGHLDTVNGEDPEALLAKLENETQEHLADAGVRQSSAAGSDNARLEQEVAQAGADLAEEDARAATMKQEAQAEVDAEKDRVAAEAMAEKDARIAELEAQLAEKTQEVEQLTESHSQEKIRLQEESDKEADEAYQKGMEEGAANRQEEVDGLQDQIAQVSQQIPTSLNNYFEELEEQMKEEVCTFALSIAESFIKKQLGDRDVLKETIKTALSPIMNYKGVTLYLNPQIAELATTSNEFALPNALTVEADPQLEVGEAMVETDMGFIDATLSRRLESLRESFDKPLSS